MAGDEAQALVPSLGMFKPTDSQPLIINANVIPEQFLFGFAGFLWFFLFVFCTSIWPYLPNHAWLRLMLKHETEQQLWWCEQSSDLELVLPC